MCIYNRKKIHKIKPHIIEVKRENGLLEANLAKLIDKLKLWGNLFNREASK